MNSVFVHNVFFSLIDRSPQRVQELVADCCANLASIPGALYFAAGTLSDVARPVSDRDYDVALHVIFDSQTTHDAYQKHPLHVEFIARQKANWAKVRVFDSNCTGGPIA